MRHRVALLPVVLLLLPGCIGMTQPNEAISIPVTGMEALAGVRGEAWFDEAWEEDAVTRGVVAAGFRVTSAGEGSLYGTYDNATGMHLLGTANGTYMIVHYRVNSSREYAYGPEMDRVAEQLWLRHEPHFLAALAMYETETNWTSELLSWRPVKLVT